MVPIIICETKIAREEYTTPRLSEIRTLELIFQKEPELHAELVRFPLSLGPNYWTSNSYTCLSYILMSFYLDADWYLSFFVPLMSSMSAHQSCMPSVDMFEEYIWRQGYADRGDSCLSISVVSSRICRRYNMIPIYNGYHIIFRVSYPSYLLCLSYFSPGIHLATRLRWRGVGRRGLRRCGAGVPKVDPSREEIGHLLQWQQGGMLFVLCLSSFFSLVSPLPSCLQVFAGLLYITRYMFW